jgi:hypothetical protein
MLAMWPEWCLKMFTYTGMVVWAMWVLFFFAIAVMSLRQEEPETDEEWRKRMTHPRRY